MPPLPKLTFPYSKVETALVRMHGIAPEHVSAFRSRFGALQRGGLLGADAQPGKGQRLVYTPDLMHRAVLAIELGQAGFVPAVTLRLISEFWDSRLRAIFDQAENEIMHPTSGSDVVLLLAGVSLISGGEQAIPNINAVPMSKLADRINLALSHDRLPGRVLAINLTAQLRLFHKALADEHLRPDQPASGRGNKRK